MKKKTTKQFCAWLTRYLLSLDKANIQPSSPVAVISRKLQEYLKEDEHEEPKTYEFIMPVGGPKKKKKENG